MSAALLRSDAVALPLADASVDLVVTSPPYFALRSYQDDGEHYDGQIGSEPTPQAFLEALWAVTAECMRVLKPSGSIFVNLGDKYAGAGGHNNGGLQGATSAMQGRKHTTARDGNRATRRQAPDSYNKTTIGGAKPKSLMGLPWRYALGCVDDLGLILRAELIWSKPNGMPESVRDRVRRSHEQWFHFTKCPTYYAEVDPIRETHTATSIQRAQPHRADPGRAYREGGATNGTGMPAQSLRLENMNHPAGGLPGSVWSIPTEPLIIPEHLNADHFAAFPQEWPRRLILGWSPPGGVVLDPFGGTGTTAMVARALGRFGISNDLSADYLRLARWRIWESRHAAKSIARTNAEAQLSLAGGGTE